MIESMVGSVAGAGLSAGLNGLSSNLGIGFSVLGTLGHMPFVTAFGRVMTFNDLTRENAVRWARHDVIGRKPILEYVGDDLSKVSLSIRFDMSLGMPPLVGLSLLKRMMENHKYKTLLIGGEYLGRYVIESIGETRKFHNGAGLCIVATADISLIEWAGKKNDGEDD